MVRDKLHDSMFKIFRNHGLLRGLLKIILPAGLASLLDDAKIDIDESSATGRHGADTHADLVVRVWLEGFIAPLVIYLVLEQLSAIRLTSCQISFGQNYRLLSIYR